MSENIEWYQPPIKANDGLVVVLDAMGVRDLDIEQTKNFLAHFHAWLTIADVFMDASCREENPLETTNQSLYRPEIVVCQDTIFITWNVIDPADYTALAIKLGAMLLKSLVHALNWKLLFRGAISAGSFISHGIGIPSRSSNERKFKVVVGPAVRDAWNWHDRAEWMGVVATPSMGFKLSSEHERRVVKSEPLFEEFVRYQVPLKGDKKSEMWCVAWPRELIGAHRDEARLRLLRYMEGFEILPGTENKYSNTLQFFEKVWSPPEPTPAPPPRS